MSRKKAYPQAVHDIIKNLRQRVADLEQQVRVLENPRVTDEDWHRLALRYKEHVAELEVDKKVINAAYADLIKSYAAAKIEGLKMALLICENWNHTWEAIKAIEDEIAKLKKP